MVGDITISDKVDLVANGIVLAVTILGMVLRHMELSSNDYGDATDRLELATVPNGFSPLCCILLQIYFGYRR